MSESGIIAEQSSVEADAIICKRLLQAGGRHQNPTCTHTHMQARTSGLLLVALSHYRYTRCSTLYCIVPACFLCFVGAVIISI